MRSRITFSWGSSSVFNRHSGQGRWLYENPEARHAVGCFVTFRYGCAEAADGVDADDARILFRANDKEIGVLLRLNLAADAAGAANSPGVGGLVQLIACAKRKARVRRPMPSDR